MKSRLSPARVVALFCIVSVAGAFAEKKHAELEDALWICLRTKFPGIERSIGDHARAFDPTTGRNFAWDKDKQAWIDTKTGECICPKCPATPAQLQDALWICLREKFPGTERSIGDHTRAFDPKTGRNFAWDKDKQAWIDVKTGECICPKCEPKQTAKPAPSPPPTPGGSPNKTENILKTIASSVDIGIGIGGGEHRHDDRARGEDRSRTADKVRTDDKVHAEDKHRTVEKFDNKVKVAHSSEVVHDREVIDSHKKRKEELERKLRGASAADKKLLEHQIKEQDEAIKKHEADLSKHGGQ